MKYPENIQEVSALGPDYLGFIFYPDSPRNFSGSIPKINSEIKKTAVFVNASKAQISELIEEHKFHAVQLHGNETPELCKELRSDFPLVEILKVFSIKDEFDFSVLKPYEAFCDFFLFDTKGKRPGGNGYVFDWNVLNTYNSDKPFFLSGGIGVEQILDIKMFFNSEISNKCYGIDVNSQFEIKPGLKNPTLLKQFILELWDSM
ncbi:phosphoribosylanthranilate isomerase [Aegicerativicinus sediminis]|uniref:phosphoribosylanthranilate isomerase n=1 Tax=Aegicerativicinus sediminis TaxID=2893202 RepID=UPI001E5E3C1A|nr:phosphoribosylanthranilate isomerase [Aegicerativicinus sediminis]